jgi:hypothetical protein
MRRDSWYVNYSSDLVEAVFDLRLSLWAGRHNNHDDGALPHVSGPDPSDPCDKKKSCGSCGGKCGWCRDEATQQQLAGTKHKGWCSSKCITTRDECGRNTKPDHGGH